MKRLVVKSIEYQELLKNYECWLKVYNYALETVETFPVHVREFLHWLEGQKSPSIKHIKTTDGEAYENYLSSRKNERDGGYLSDNSLHKHFTAVNNFMNYLRLYVLDLERFYIKAPLGNSKQEVFSRKEIELLYESSREQGREGSYFRGIRDRAILGIYYGCGLRLSEGIALEIEDIDIKKHVLEVRKGKGGKRREVPIGMQFLEDLEEWIYEGRYWYEKQQTNALLLNCYGSRLGSNGIYHTLNRLKSDSRIIKQASLHGLRHSVASHLLESGMDLENIREFLGHASLESTQIYLHLAYENE